MATRGPNPAGSQFFITEGPTQMLDDGARPGAHYQIFGQCTPAELVQKLAAQPRDGRDKPFQDLKITKLTVRRGSDGKADAKAAPAAGKAAGKPAPGPGKPAGGILCSPILKPGPRCGPARSLDGN